MNNRLFILLVLFCLFTHIIRTIYEILKHKKILKPDRLSFTVMFLNMVLLWTSWFVLCRLDKSVIYLPGIISWFGIILVVAGVILFLVALFTIKTLETFKGDLITYGIYSKIRHPMYLGFLFWSIGSPVFDGALYSFILAILFSINVLYWRHLEEIELVNRFPGYISYKAKTIF